MALASALSADAKRRYRHAAFDRARRLYRLLLRLIGGANPVCAWCQRDENECELTIDHVHGKTWRANKIRMDERIKRYRDEFKRGVKFRILCRECNSKDGRARQLEGRVHAMGDVKVARVERKLAEKRAKLDLEKLFDSDVPF